MLPTLGAEPARPPHSALPADFAEHGRVLCADENMSIRQGEVNV